jgi:hypothetical protein
MAEDRVSVWEYINPIPDYTSARGAFIYGTYSGLSKGRAVMPMLIPTEGWMGGPGRAFQKYATGTWSKLTTQSFRTGTVSRYVGTTGRFLLFGGGTDLGPEARAVARGGTTAWRKYVLKQGGYGIQSEAMIKATLAKLSAGPSASTYAKAGLIGMGRVINPLINLYMAYQVASFAAEATMKGIKTMSDIIGRAGDRISNMELGGELSRGYMGSEAATERQRAIQAIQSSHLSGRRFLGNEAAMYHE